MLIKQDFYFHHLGATRRLHIRLPDGPGPFPVMYFFDGHNLYDDRDATFGKSWGFVPYLRGWDRDSKMPQRTAQKPIPQG